ncbi:MAG: LPS-assembly protein LptD [Treponema sp.]|nr:LPS-assembly protein LptD [Treponema sp.]
MFRVLRGSCFILFFLYLVVQVPVFGQEADGDTPVSAPDSLPEAGGEPAEGEAGTEEAETDEPVEDEAGVEEPPAEEISPEARILELDIKTSTLNELARWCRSLGLSEGGSKETLANRLRDYYNLRGLPAERQDKDAAASKKKTIIIESARSTEYFTLEAVDEEYARLRGDVLVTLKDGEAVHRIHAWEILYNRTRNIMSASGGVEYVKEEGDTKETFRGESIVVNLDDWSSVFMDSVSERSLTQGDTVYRFSGTLITRNNEDVTILSRSEITTGKSEESYWSISASKLWLLPGSDWAIFNAVLKVGNIPVLYIPFFFYPANELIFRPVLGTRSREGNFIQTTTYILGRPQSTSTSESSITRILGNSADNVKIREGIFLRSTNKKSVDPNDTRLSLLADWYANMGGYLGTEAALPRKGILGAQTISAGLGFTRNIYLLNSGNFYSPFSADVSSSEWNKSRMFSTEVPFRYRLEAKGSLSGTYGSLNWNFPFYSDRYVNRDFLNRSEEMDWVKMLKDGGESSEDYLSNYLGSYSLQMNSSLSPKITALNPYISSLALSIISSSISFGNRASLSSSSASGRIAPHTSPDDSFFYPDKLTILSLSASIQGKPLQLPNTTQTPQTSQTSQAQAEAPEDPFKNIGVPRSPWAVPEQNEAAGVSADPYHLTPPVLSQKFDLPKFGSSRFSIEYQFNPAGASELQFRSNSTNWPTKEDVDWGDISSVLTSLRTDGSVAFSLTDVNTSAYTTKFRVYGNAAWQGYSLMNEEAEDYDTQTERDNAQRRLNAATLFTTSAESITTIKPFFRSSLWGNTNFQYTLRGLVAKSVFNNSVDSPEWDIEWGEWHRDKLDAHQAQANLNASVFGKEQTLSLASDLPPEQNTLSGSATVRAWISETSASQKIINPFEDDRKFDPLKFTETLKFAPNYQAVQQFTFDPDLEEFTGMSSSLTLNKFTAAFNASRSKPYELVDGQGWIQPAGAEEKLNPQALKFSYSNTFAKQELWNGRISLSVVPNTTLTFDLQRYSFSQLDFSLGFKLGISKFLDLEFSTSSKNSVVMRYFQDFPFVNLPKEIPGEKNFFVDLLNSFRFDDKQMRMDSGFKLKSFKIALTHYLGDWTAKLDWTISPYLPTGERNYKFNNTISFIVQWTPITEIKTDIYYDKEVLEIR